MLAGVNIVSTTLSTGILSKAQSHALSLTSSHPASAISVHKVLLQYSWVRGTSPSKTAEIFWELLREIEYWMHQCVGLIFGLSSKRITFTVKWVLNVDKPITLDTDVMDNTVNGFSVILYEAQVLTVVLILFQAKDNTSALIIASCLRWMYV